MKHLAASKGVTGSLVGAGVGAASYFVAAKVGPKIPVLQGRWWALPSALLVAGHLTKRYSQETGQAVVGAAGALLAFSYFVQAQTTANPSATTAPAAAKGFSDAGALTMPTYAPSLPASRYRGRAGAGSAYSEAGALVT